MLALAAWLVTTASATSTSPADPGEPTPLTDDAGEEAEAPLQRGFLHTTLDNGLTVSILTDPRMPVVATQHWVRVGSAHEAPDQRGFAHLFEHMMFSATESLPRGEYAKYHTRVGGHRNAYTTRDHTTYVSAVAPQHHDDVLVMEAERLRDLVFDPDEMAKDRNIVTEELRLRTENSPMGRLYVQLGVKLLDEHPYARSPVGTKEDIEARTIDDARSFYDDYYRPEHVHLVIVGPVPGEPTLARVEELYGDLPRGDVEPPEVTPLPELDWPDELELADRIPPVKATGVAYALPPMTHPDALAVRTMVQMLTGTEIDPFRQLLVVQGKKALEAGSFSQRYRAGGVLVFGSVSLPFRRKKRAFTLIDETVDQLSELEWNTREALDAARRSALRTEHFGVFSAEGMARRIGYAEYMRGDVRLAFETSERLDALTTDDIARVWKTWVADAEPTRVFVHRGKPEAP